jgi:NAD(P)-dependent dehydrogenase (short-subunit alcohol dehydrogenase family)
VPRQRHLWPRFGWTGRPHGAGARILITTFHRRIINTGGESGALGQLEQSDHSVAKAGLAALTQTLAGDQRDPQNGHNANEHK